MGEVPLYKAGRGKDEELPQDRIEGEFFIY